MSLQFKTEEEQVYRYLFQIEQDIQTITEDIPQFQKQKEGMEYEFRILKVMENGDRDILVMINRVFVDQKGPMGNRKYDSRFITNPKDNFEKIYASMIGKSFRMRMNEYGLVVEVSGADEMIKEMVDEAGLEPGSRQEEDLKSAMVKQFGNVAIAENLSSLTDFYPTEPVKEGENWEKSFQRTANLGLQFHSKFTLSKRSAGKAQIHVESELATLADSEPLNIGLMSIQYDLTGTQSGNILVDENSGWTIKTSLVQKLSGDMIINSSELPFGAVNATMNSEAKILLERIEE